MLSRLGFLHDGAPELVFVFDAQRAPAVANRHGSWLPVGQIEHVLFRAKECSGAGRACCGFEKTRVPSCVSMMIAEHAVADQVEGSGTQIREKCGRVPDATEDEKASRLCVWVFNSRIFALQDVHRFDVHPCIENRCLRFTPDDGLDSGSVIGSRNDDDIRAREGRCRLPQAASREQMTSAEGIACIQENDIDVAS